MFKLAKTAMAAACVSLMPLPALAQGGDPGVPAQTGQDPNAIFAELANVAQITAAAKKCNWTDPMYVLASESMLAIKSADLKAMVAPGEQAQVEAALQQSAASVSGFACKQADGSDAPQEHQITMFVMDQYWRMIAHVDVLGSLRWGEALRFTPAERKALDDEIAHIKEFKGYGYNQVANPLETLADNTAALACRERPSNGKPCRPVPPAMEVNAPTIKAIIETTEAFGKAVAAPMIAEEKAFAAAVGDISKFSTFADAACKADTLTVKMSDALTKTKVTGDGFGQMTQEVTFAEKYRLGQPEPVGWILLFRSMMTPGASEPYVILAEEGGEWDEESARIGAGEVENLYEAQLDVISKLPPEQRESATRDAEEAVAQTYFDNFAMMGLMQTINGGGGLTLKQCKPG
jgi:hypothetical protein